MLVWSDVDDTLRGELSIQRDRMREIVGVTQIPAGLTADGGGGEPHLSVAQEPRDGNCAISIVIGENLRGDFPASSKDRANRFSRRDIPAL